MTDGLLPEGVRDRLSPKADAMATLLRRVMDTVAAQGYGRVQPPLVEFEDALAGQLKGTGKPDLFRIVDPVSARTLALRPDMTAQIGRIATTRLAMAPRPLRLGYGGQVLKLRGTMLRPERELCQAGAELIGNDSVVAATEVVRLAVAALEAAGVTNIIVDITLPDVVDTLADTALPLPYAQRDAVRKALDGKDAAGLAALGAQAYLPLIAAAGPYAAAVAQLRAIPAFSALTPRLDAVEALAAALHGTAEVTLDPTERHGFEYQTWLGFSLFGKGAHGESIRGEVGRGGSYTIMHHGGHEETALGFSLYLDPLVDAGLGQMEARRVFLPLGSDQQQAEALRAQGWVTIAALDAADAGHAFGCTHILHDGAPVTI